MDSIPISLLCRDCGDLGFKWGIYLPIYPVYVEAEDRSRHEFAIAVDENLHGLDLGSIDDFRREYRMSVTKIRLHQPSFRSRVLYAYNSTCAICRLHHSELLDAAHILPDGHPRGTPIVPNGITLCKLHHAALDRNLLGIRPDFVVEIRSELLREIDGPMLQHDIKEMNGTQLELPGERASRPDTARLEERYQELIEVARPRPYRQGLRSRLVNDNTTDALGPACWGVMRTLLSHSERARLGCRWRVAIWQSKMEGAAKSVMQWWGDVFGLGGRTALLRHYDVKHHERP